MVFWWRCFCPGVLAVMFLWWCFCGGVFVVVFLWWYFCGGVLVVVFLRKSQDAPSYRQIGIKPSRNYATTSYTKSYLETSLDIRQKTK